MRKPIILFILFLLVLSSYVYSEAPNWIQPDGVDDLYGLLIYNGNINITFGGDFTINTSDTNESTRFDFLIGTDCEAGQVVIGINATGGVLCADDIDTNVTQVIIQDFGFFYSEANLTDLLDDNYADISVVDTDTNVTIDIVKDWGFFYSETNLTDLLDDNYADISVVDTDTNMSAGGTMIGNFNLTHNMTLGTSGIEDNGTCLLISRSSGTILAVCD